MPQKKSQKEIIEPRYAWVVVIAVSIAALALMIRSYNGFREELRSRTEFAQETRHKNQEGLAWIEVDFGGGKKRLFEGDVGRQTYTLDVALFAAAQAGNFTFGMEKGRLTELAGLPNKKENWIVYRNGERVRGAALDKLMIAHGDQYTFRYE